MGKLNAPRDQPYDFKVFEMDGIVWLFDDSDRTHICSALGVIFAEPLYWTDGECDEILPDANYFDPDVAKNPQRVRGEYPKDMSEKEAWDDARDEAHSNHIL